MIGLVVWRGVLLGAVAASALPAAAVALDDRIPELQSSPCLWPVVELLGEWGSEFRWTRLDLEEPVYGSPTATTGVWTVVTAGPREVVVRRVAADSEVKIVFDATCARSFAADATGSNRSRSVGFDDAALEKIRASGTPTIVYAWSPHMPLSVAGLKELRSVAGASGVDVIAVLDPQASLALAERTARDAGFGRDVLEPIASTELLMRGLTLHYPASTLIRGREIGVVRRGFDPAESWKRHLAESLAAPQ